MLCKNVAGYGLTNYEGRPIAIGGFAELDLKEPHDLALIEDGLVIEASQHHPGPKQKALNEGDKKNEDAK